MCCLLRLWRDDAGFVLSSEMVLVGTLGVVGATVGLNALSTAVNEELEDVAFAFRSLDQSYEVREIRGCGAWTAGSSFHQEPVKESLRELDEQIDRDQDAREDRERELRERLERAEREALDRKRDIERNDDDRREMKRPDERKAPPKKAPQRGDQDEEEVVL